MILEAGIGNILQETTGIIPSALRDNSPNQSDGVSLVILVSH